MDQYLGQLLLVGFNFAPSGWAFCNGQTLAISQNTALFSLLGTTFGGNGQTTFALPDMQGRIPVSSGTSPYILGSVLGTEGVTLVTNQLPTHTHQLSVGTTPGALGPALGNSFAGVSGTATFGPSGDVSMDTSAITSAGASQSHSNLMPYVTLNWIIALQGIYPSRS